MIESAEYSIKGISKWCNVLEHAFSHGRWRQSPETGSHVIWHVVHFGGSRYHTGDRRVWSNKLKKKLSPAFTVKLLGPSFFLKRETSFNLGWQQTVPALIFICFSRKLRI